MSTSIVINDIHRYRFRYSIKNQIKKVAKMLKKIKIS